MIERRFKTGQEVVCVNKHGWTDQQTGRESDKPAYNEICIVAGYDPRFPSDSSVFLEGYNIPEDSYEDRAFEPLISDAILESELEEIEKQEFAINYDEYL
jgi:hypothetical protein